MVYLAIFILIFTGLQFLVALSNLLFQQNFSPNLNTTNELISVLIPARNEETNLPLLLSDLQNQDYNNLEIIVFNDQSEDKTAQIVAEFAQKDKRIRLINSGGLPPGWLGKNNACHNLALHAAGKYFLFLDADVRAGKSLVRNAIHFSKKYGLGLISIFPRQIMKTWGERLTVPNMNYILLSLLPLILVRKTVFPSMAAANGQFMFFDAEIYRKLLPHQQMKESKVEDIEIARYYKNIKIRIACLTGVSSISCRMYSGFKEAIYGFSKNVILFFGGSYLLATLFWLITTFGFLPVWFSFSSVIFMIWLTAVILTRIFVSVASQQPVFQNIVLFPMHQISLGLFIAQAIFNSLKKQYIWKGRKIVS